MNEKIMLFYALMILISLMKQDVCHTEIICCETDEKMRNQCQGRLCFATGEYEIRNWRGNREMS